MPLQYTSNLIYTCRTSFQSSCLPCLEPLLPLSGSNILILFDSFQFWAPEFHCFQQILRHNCLCQRSCLPSTATPPWTRPISSDLREAKKGRAWLVLEWEKSCLPISFPFCLVNSNFYFNFTLKLITLAGPILVPKTYNCVLWKVITVYNLSAQLLEGREHKWFGILLHRRSLHSPPLMNELFHYRFSHVDFIFWFDYYYFDYRPMAL